MKLIGSNTSPYVRKVRIVMAEKKLDYQYVLEDVWANDNMLKSNPLGKVPCLVVEGVEAIFDSRVIVEYVDTLSPVGRLIPPTRPRTRRGAHLGVAGRWCARCGDRGAPGGQLATARRSALAGLDRPQHEPRHRRAQGDGARPRREAVVRRACT